RRPCAHAHDRCGGGANPVARIPHRRQLPALELLLRGLGERHQRVLEPLGEIGRRLHRLEGLAEQRLEVGGAGAHLEPPFSAPSDTIPSSCLIARCSKTLVAPSERPSARAISRLSIPSAKRMISASRRSSGSFWTPARIALSSSRPSTRDSVVCVAAMTPASSIAETGLRDRSR